MLKKAVARTRGGTVAWNFFQQVENGIGMVTFTVCVCLPFEFLRSGIPVQGSLFANTEGKQNANRFVFA